MKSRAERLFSPAVLATISGCLGILAAILPMAVYEGVLGERKFTDARIALYILLSLSLFLLGHRLTPKARPRITIEQIASNRSAGKVFAYLIILILISSLVANTWAIFRFFSGVHASDFFSSMIDGASMSSSVTAAYLDSVSGISWLLAGVLPVIVLAFWLNWHFGVAVIPPSVLYSATFLSLLRPSLRGDRGLLLGLIVPLCLARMHLLARAGKLSWRRFAIALGAVVGLGAALFIGFQLVRLADVGTTGRDSIFDFGLRQIAGYYLGSYNRFGVQMTFNGPIVESNGYYILSFVRDLPILNHVLPLEEWVRMLTNFTPPPDFFSIWTRYGVDHTLNAVTAFGITYMDLGWFGVLLFLPYGSAAKLLYTSLNKHGLWGLLLYWPTAWTVLEWRGKLEITNFNYVSQLLVSCMLLGATALLLRIKRGQARYGTENDGA